MSDINQKYMFFYQRKNRLRYYFIKRVHDQESVCFTYKTLRDIVSKYKVKILEAIHQHIQIQITKEQIVQQLIKEAKLSKMNVNCRKVQRLISEKTNLCNLDQLFGNFKIQIITPKILKHCFRLIKEPQLFEIIGRKNIKKEKLFHQLIQIKYKYLQNPSFFFTLTKYLALKYNPFRKLMSLNSQIQITEVNHEDNINLSPDFRLPNFYKVNKVLGKSRIRRTIFYLFKSPKKSIQSANWYQQNLPYHNNTLNIQRINKKIKQSNFDIEKEIFFDKEIIKQEILRQIKAKQKWKKTQKNISNQRLDQMAEQKIKQFLIKHQQIQQEVYNYYNKAIQMFNSYQQTINFDFLRRNVNQAHKKFQKSGNDTCFFYAKNNKKQADQKVKIKQQSYEDIHDDSESFYDSSQVDQSQHFVKLQKSFSQTSFDSEDQLSYQNSSQFFQKIKTQCKQQTEETYLLQNRSKKSKRKIQTKTENIKLKAEAKKLKSQIKNNFFDSDNDEETEAKKQEPSTSLQLSSKQESHQSFCQVKETKVQENPRVIEISKIKHALFDECLYLIKFNDGKIVHGTFSEVIQLEGVNQEMLKNAKDIFSINKQNKIFV